MYRYVVGSILTAVVMVLWFYQLDPGKTLQGLRMVRYHHTAVAATNPLPNVAEAYIRSGGIPAFDSAPNYMMFVVDDAEEFATAPYHDIVLVYGRNLRVLPLRKVYELADMVTNEGD